MYSVSSVVNLIHNYYMMKINILFLTLLLVMLASCGSSRKVSQPASVESSQVVLSPEQQRRYDYFFLEATRLKAKKEYDAAFDLLQHCLAVDSTAASALYEVSQYYMYLKMVPQGRAALEKAVRNAPDNYWYNQALASFYQQQGLQDEAIEAFETMVTRFPRKQEPLLGLLDLYNQKEDYQKVINTLNLMEGRMGKSEQITMEKFRIYLQMKDDKKAFREIESLVEEYPMDMRYQVVLGDVYLQNGKKEEAYNAYKKVLSAEPDNAMALFSLASYYDETGQKELYEQQIDTLLLNQKVPSETKMEIMRQFIVKSGEEGKDSLRIMNLFDRIMEVDTDDAQIPMLYSQYLLSKGNQEKADTVLAQVVRIEPANKAARLMLLGSAVRKNDYKKVIDICEPGIEATPEALEFYFYLAIAYNQSERWDDVLSVSQKALEQVTGESNKNVVSDFYAIIGDVYHTKKMMKEAYAAYDSALVYNPSNIGALNNYAYYLSVERRDLDKAEEMSYQTVKAEPGNATYLDTYAWILFEKGKYTEARIYIDDAIKNTKPGEESSVVYEHCGDIYYMTGDADKALEYWKKADALGDSESKTLKQKIEKKKYIAE